jgi:hypothetical protein
MHVFYICRGCIKRRINLPQSDRKEISQRSQRTQLQCYIFVFRGFGIASVSRTLRLKRLLIQPLQFLYAHYFTKLLVLRTLNFQKPCSDVSMVKSK